jgi:prolyl oligopeptidase
MVRSFAAASPTTSTHGAHAAGCVKARGAWSAFVILCTPLWAQTPSHSSWRYPAARRDSVVDDYFGAKIADPYRWLEQADRPATVEWVRAQRGLTSEYLARIPARVAIRRRLATLWNYRRTEVPWREAGRLFFVENSGHQPQPVLYVQSDPGDAPHVVLDPRVISPDGSLAIGDYAASPDGRWLAYSRAPGGGIAAETRVRELSTGRELHDVVRGTRGTACWTFDGAGFFYVRSPGEAVTAARLEKLLFYHALGQPQARDRPIHEWPDARWLYCMLSDDGRRAFIVAERGAGSWMYMLDLGDPQAPDLTAPLVPLLGGREARHTPMGTVGDTLYVFTDLDAPRGRVIALSLREGAQVRARPVVPESPDVIQWATVAGDRLAVHYLVDVTSRLRLFTLDGRPAGEVPLPGIGAVGWPVNGRYSAPELLFSFTSFLSPETVYYYDLRTGRSAPFRPPRVAFDPRAYGTRQVFYVSKDGTRIPMFVTAKRTIRADGTNPVLLMSYGANGLIEGPSYRPDVALWLELGGVYAVANVRGGGEYGEEWHRAGNLEHKQRSFDDFIAAAEYLVARRYTTAGKLAIYGHSSGGLLIGAVMTQRPDLFAVALPSAGHYDMLRYHKFTVGAGWIPEYGSPEDSAAFGYLRVYSPLQHVQPGTCYPATLLLTADHDDTVVPGHSYKFAAALQAAQACPRPILLRVASNASHSYASAAEAIAERADLWAFVVAQLGIRLPGTW